MWEYIHPLFRQGTHAGQDDHMQPCILCALRTRAEVASIETGGSIGKLVNASR